MRRFATLLIVLTFVAAGAVWISSWSSEREIAIDEPCRIVDRCVARFDLDVSELGLIDGMPSRRGLETLASGEQLLAAVEGRSASVDDASNRFVVASFDALTGQLERTLYEREGRAASIGHLAISPDEQVVAVSTSVLEIDGTEAHDIVVIRLSSGEIVSMIETPSTYGGCVLSFSADSSVVRCLDRLYAVESGLVIDSIADAEVDTIEELRWSVLAHIDTPDVSAEISGRVVNVRAGDERWSFPTGLSSGSGSGFEQQLALSPDGDVVVHQSAPDRVSNGTEVVVYGIADGEVLSRIDRSKAIEYVSWLGDRELVTMAGDLQIVIYDVS